MKKILAGVLAAASMLTVSATAFAASNDKTVTAAGDLEYDVAVTAPKIALNLVMPSKMAAALNPYGAAIKLEAKDTGAATTTATIASTAYEIKNLSKENGVFIDATAITTIETSDAPKADKSPAWGVIKEEVEEGTKNANLALMGGASADAFKDVSNNAIDPADESSAAAKSSNKIVQGALVLDSTVKADKTKNIAAGQTSQKKFIFVPVATSDTAPGTAYMAFIGKLAETKPAVTTSGSEAPEQEVVWNDDDAINVNLVLKVTAGPSDLK